MSIIGTLNKQPHEVRRADLDYATAFLGVGQSVTATTITSSGVALVVTQTNTMPDTAVNLLIAGGADGQTYTVTVLSEISDGQVIESEIVVVVEEITV